MTTFRANEAACQCCNFAPFCITNEQMGQPTFDNHVHLKRSESLHCPKHPGLKLFAVKRGALKAYQVEAEGREIIRGFYFAGDIIGYEAIYNKEYLYTTVALTDSELCEIPYEQFLTLLHTRPKLQERILYLMSRELTVGTYAMAVPAEQRLAAFLLDIKKRLKCAAGYVELPMTRQDIGNYLSLTAETVSRILSRFQQQTFIRLQGKTIYLLDEGQLQQIATGLRV